MSKNLFVGVDGKARKAKEFYVGVDGKAHRIVKAYIGDENGKARPFWDNESNIAENSLEFVSDNSFTMSAAKLWNGTLTYNNGNGWTTWSGGQISSSEINGRQRIYFRGSRNTVIRGQNATETNSWKITGSNIECNGNIEYLLDYQKVAAGQHPEMGMYCYREMFSNCSSLITSPELPAITLVYGCYQDMFKNCSSLTTAPALPATTLAVNCYKSMFTGCSKLTTAPQLSATTLAESCYDSMFFGCNITTAPALPATILKKGCYKEMFALCSSLTKAPKLPATTLEENCYYQMFEGCHSLTEAPSLLATKLAVGCYREMFINCRELTRIPALNATTLMSYCYNSMFKNCPKVKPATEQSENYSVSYRVPIFATATSQPANSMTDMFSSSTESNVEYHINTTYWLPKTASVIIS